MEETKKKVEAILFAVGRAISENEISELSGIPVHEVHSALVEMKKDYSERDSPLLVFQEGDSWKLTVHEKHLSMVQKISPHTELSKAILETLAVIAWKQPATQSEVIKIRSNKAYEHIDELEKLGFISREKYKRTYLVKVTGKFFDYFDLPEGSVKEVFKDVKDVEEAQTKLAEHEVKTIGKLQEYGEKDEVALEKEGKEHVGDLEVFEEVEPKKPLKFEEDENPIEDFLKENKKPAPQEIEEGLAEEVEEEKETKEEAKSEIEETEKEESSEQQEEKESEEESKEKPEEEREVDPELEEMVKEKKKKQ